MQFSNRRSTEDRLGNFLSELKNRPQPEILPSDVVKFSDPLRAVFNHATRTGNISLPEMSQMLDLPEEETQKLIDFIVEIGFLRALPPLDEEPMYETRMAVRTRRRDDALLNDILGKLDKL